MKDKIVKPQDTAFLKLAVIVTHPIQYYAPIFKILAKHTDLKVFYTRNEKMKYDSGFQRTIDWDIPLLEGYTYEFINCSNAISRILYFHPGQLLIYGWPHLSHLAILYYFKGKVPILFRGDSTLLNEKPGLKQFIKYHILKWIFSHIDKVIYTGTNNKAYFIKYGFKNHQLFFAPPAIDNRRFSILQTRLKIRESLKLAEIDTLILYAGKFIKKKNLRLLIQAFKMITTPNTHLLLIGGGRLERRLKTMSKGYWNIHFMPFHNQKNMPELYQACDLFCLPSQSESWGLSVNEAMAAGKAILASSNVGAAIDLVKNINGSIFKNGDLKDLKEKLNSLLNSKEQLEQKGRHSALIIRDWAFESQVNHIIHAIKQ